MRVRVVCVCVLRACACVAACACVRVCVPCLMCAWVRVSYWHACRAPEHDVGVSVWALAAFFGAVNWFRLFKPFGGHTFHFFAVLRSLPSVLCVRVSARAVTVLCIPLVSSHGGCGVCFGALVGWLRVGSGICAGSGQGGVGVRAWSC